MADQSFRVIITAVDRATAVMRTINRNVGGLTRPFKQVTESAGRFLEAAGFEKMAHAAEGVWVKVEKLGEGIRALAGPVAALGAAASVAGLVEMAKGASEYGDKLYLASKKTGIAAGELARLHYVAQTTEVDAGAMDKALFQLNRRLADASAGKNKDAAAMFAALHIPLKDGAGHVRTAGQVWGDLAEAIRKNENPAIRARIAATAFGARVGADLIPALELGREKTQEIGAEFDRFHGKFTNADAERAHEAAEGWRRLGLAAQGLKDTIGANLAPALQRVIEPMTAWLAANRQLVSQRVSDTVRSIGDTMRQVDWKGIADSVRTIGGAFGAVFRALGPGKSMLLGLGLAFAPTLLAFGKLAGAIATVGARLGMLAFASIAGAVGNFVTALRAGYGAMAAFNLVMAANPIGMVIVGVAAVAGAAYLIYRNWTPIKAFFASLWSGVVSATRAAVNGIASLLKWLWDHSPLKLIIDTIGRMAHLPGVQAAMNAVSGGLKTAVAAVTIAAAPVAAAHAAAPVKAPQVNIPAPVVRAAAVNVPPPQVTAAPVKAAPAVNLRATPVNVPAQVISAPAVNLRATPVNVPAQVISAPVVSQSSQRQTPVIARRNPVPQAEQSRGPTNGQVAVKIDVNAPRGTEVRTTTSGRNPPPVDIGRRFEPGF